MRRDKGLCYTCEEKFVIGHKCKSKLFLLVHQDDEFNEEHQTDHDITFEPTYFEQDPTAPNAHLYTRVFETPHISFYAMLGHSFPEPLRLNG